MDTIGDWRVSLRRRLRHVAGEFVAFETDLLLHEITGWGPTELTVHHAEPLSADQKARIEELAVERLRGRPLAYVLGHVEFYGLDFLCDERALIPRPETEQVVDLALRALAPPGSRSLTVVDVGTGCGNIALTLAHQRPDLRVIATDVSDAALQLAHANRARLKLEGRVVYVRGNLLTMIQPKSVDLVISNPPYVPHGDPALERAVADYEPPVALFGGPDGLTVLEELIAQAAEVLSPGGVLVCEIGFGQGDAVRTMVARYPQWQEPAIHRDLPGVERVLVVPKARIP